MPLVFAVAIAAISMTCVAAAAFLAWHQRSGWGGFFASASGRGHAAERH
jgi:hypothetical protein